MKKELVTEKSMPAMIITNAATTGFTQVFVNSVYPKRVLCSRCKKYEAMVFRADTNVQNLYHTAFACPCGWRKFVGKDNKTAPKKGKIVFKPVCATDGCNAVLKDKDENGGFCYKCRPANKGNAGAPVEMPSKCVGKSCSNPLPPDRKAYCYACRPRTTSTEKEAAPTPVYV